MTELTPGLKANLNALRRLKADSEPNAVTVSAARQMTSGCLARLHAMGLANRCMKRAAGGMGGRWTHYWLTPAGVDAAITLAGR